MVKYEIFMSESNGIEGELNFNPGDRAAFDFSLDTGLKKGNQILKVHELLTEHLKVHWSGEWRDCDVTVGGHQCPSYFEVDDLIEKYLRALPDMDSWTAHNEFLYIHPFRDFNGRVARLIWLSRATDEGYRGSIPFLQKYYYQTLERR